ncbi:MAG: ATP-binding protein, partial [Fibrobacteraceae bacterium]|nr:ATP-binding protein [Fibrobacteraceae bacterium]
LMNLLSNALKFTKSVDGYVRFSAKQLQKENGIARLQIQVQDNGIGISKNFKKHLFNPFEQDTNNVVRKNIGSGLGLSITQSLVKLMGGTISVESEEGNGSTFTVQIPFAIAQEPEKKFTPIQNISDEFQFNREKILLVEDNELNAKIATMLLEMKNLQVERASNGRIAFEKFKENPDNYYDLVLMDIRMPVMGGIDATRAIRSFPKKYAREIPIIAMSAEVFEEDVKRSIEAGMNAHLAKPIDVRTLYGTLAKFLKGYEK